MPSPRRVAEGEFLDDLFTNLYRRGDGTGEALVRCAGEIAAKRGRGAIWWITRYNNYQVRGLYARLSHRFDRVASEMTAATTGREVK